MEKLFKWAAALFLSAVFALLSMSAFQHWSPPTHISNKVMKMVIALQQFMVNTVGDILTGCIFAACALGILVLAWHDKESDSPADSQTV